MISGLKHILQQLRRNDSQEINFNDGCSSGMSITIREYHEGRTK
jgi:hypothetical protein